MQNMPSVVARFDDDMSKLSWQEMPHCMYYETTNKEKNQYSKTTTASSAL